MQTTDFTFRRKNTGDSFLDLQGRVNTLSACLDNMEVYLGS